MTSVVLATEDILSECIGTKLLQEIDITPIQIQYLRRNGAGYLYKMRESWKKISIHRPVLLITDLDQRACASEMKHHWLGSATAPANLLMRVAVREIESWILADHDAIRQLIGTKGKLPPMPDHLPDPKAHLVQLAKSAPREVRSDMIKEQGAAASQGIGYNTRLQDLIQTRWNAERAATRSDSLARARIRIRELAGRL